MKRKRTEPDYFSNVPISRAVIRPDGEIRNFGGLVWSDEHGIGIGMVDGTDWVQELSQLMGSSDLISPGFRLDADGNAARE